MVSKLCVSFGIIGFKNSYCNPVWESRLLVEASSLAVLIISCTIMIAIGVLSNSVFSYKLSPGFYAGISNSLFSSLATISTGCKPLADIGNWDTSYKMLTI